MCSAPLTEEDVDKKLGKRMVRNVDLIVVFLTSRFQAEEGYTPKLPVVIVPGFGSSSLEVTKSYISVSVEHFCLISNHLTSHGWATESGFHSAR